MNKGKLVYRHVAELINRAIEVGDLTGRLPSERELSIRYGVSRVTVRRALELLLDAHIVHRLARKGTFVGRATIAVGIPVKRRIAFFRFGSQAMTHYETVLIAGLSQRCGVAGYHLFVETFTDNHALRQRFATIYQVEQPDLCIMSGVVSQGSAQFITAGGIPVLLLDNFIANALLDSYDSCCLNWYNWGYRAARYFISHGYRRIALVTGAVEIMKNIEIAAGLVAAHEEDDLIRNKDLTVHCRTESMQAGVDAIMQLMELEYPDALIAGSNLLGTGVLLGIIQMADERQKPVITVGVDNNSKLNIYQLEYLNFDEHDAVSKCWNLLERRLKHPTAPPKAVCPAWSF